MSYTRKQYLNKECTHREYYAQFVDSEVTETLGNLPLDGTPLHIWDNLPPVGREISNQMRSCGDWLTNAGNVCIYKEAAKQRDEAL